DAVERHGRLHDLRPAVAVDVRDDGRLAVDDLLQLHRETLQQPAVGRDGGQARGETRLHEDQVFLSIAVHVGGHEVGVDLAGQTGNVGDKPHRPRGAGQGLAEAVEAQDDPLVHAADDFEFSVAVEVREQGRNVRAGEEV